MEAEQNEIAENDSGDELAEHRRLVDSLGQLAADLGRQQHDHQAQQHRGHRAGVAAALTVATGRGSVLVLGRLGGGRARPKGRMEDEKRGDDG